MARPQFDYPSMCYVDCGGGTPWTYTVAMTISDKPNRFLTVLVPNCNGGNPSSVKYNGVDLTRIYYIQDAGHSAELWVLVAPATGTHNLVVQGNGVSPLYSYAIATCWYHVDQSTPYDGGGTSSGASSTASQNIQTTASSVALYCGKSSNTAHTVTLADIKVVDPSSSSANQQVWMEYFNGDASNHTSSVTISASRTWRGCGINIRPDGDTETVLNASADTQIASGAATTNYGTSTEFFVEQSQGQRGLLQFDLSSLVGKSITSAVLKTYITYDDGWANVKTFNLYRVLRVWTEAGVTWNKYDGANNWGTAGCDNTSTDRSSTIMATNILPQYASGWMYFQFDITEFGLLVPSNNGFIMIETTVAAGVRIASKENATAWKQPRLEVAYSSYVPRIGWVW